MRGFVLSTLLTLTTSCGDSTSTPAASAHVPPTPATAAPAVATLGAAITAEAKEEPPTIAATSHDEKRILLVHDGHLYVADADGSSESRLVAGDGSACLPDGDDCLSLQSFFNIEFHPDGRRALFSVAPGRGEVICTVDLETKEVTRLAWAFGYEHILIGRGPHRGNLLLYKLKYHADAPGVFPMCVLVDGNSGRELLDLTDIDPECIGTPKTRRRLGF